MKPFHRLGTRLIAAATLLLIGLPAFAQYNSNDITPPISNSGKLTAAASGKQVGGSGNGHAILLKGNALTSVDLNPVGYYNSMATSTDDVDQCGYGYNGNGMHAMKWSGSAATFVDLAAAYNNTYCTGTHGGQQVGYGETFIYAVSIQRATLWTGSLGSIVTLHPGNLSYAYSKALGVRNGQQVGYMSTGAYSMADNNAFIGSHAVLWTGTAASYVDLNPIGYDSSQALATNGTQQGGWGHVALGTSVHAMLWSGTPDNGVDLHPAGFSDSRITALAATQQVGDAWVGAAYQAGSVRHAMVWSGTAASAIDLNQYLPTGYTNAVATGIDANGNVVGYAYNTYVQGMTIPPDAIAVVFAPGQASPTALASLTLTPGNLAPGGVLQGTVSIPAPAPAGGVAVSFVSADQTMIPAPTPVTIPAGQMSVAFSIATGGSTLQVPTSTKVYATDGTVSRSATITLTPIVTLSTVTINPVEGGFSTTGSIALSIPAQVGGATITLTNSNPTLVTMPASITIPPGSSTANFSVTTKSVATATSVPVTAALIGNNSISTSVALSPAPVVGVSAVTFAFPAVVGGQSIGGTVTVNNFPRDPNGITITLLSSDTNTLQVPATVVIPYGGYSASFTATTIVVNGTKGVSVKATYNTSNITTPIQVTPIPTITITKADYYTDTNLLKISATTTNTTAILTYGTDPNLPSVGTMAFELGAYNAAVAMPTAPAFATVWSSLGGQATMVVTQRTTPAGGGGGGGGSTTPKLIVSKSSKGNVTSSPAAISCGATCTATFAVGTVVTLTATPAAGASFGGWNGACVGTSPTCTLTMTADKSVSPVFR